MVSVQAATTDDPFDAADYNPIHHLNILFAQPKSLSSVSAVAASLRSHQDALDFHISSRVVSQRDADTACVARIHSAKTELSTLFSKIESVQARALDTEQSITSMTAEIKRLDNTKRNLTHSMTTLKRLQMLTSAYEQLRVLKATRQYRECSGLLAAVIQLMAHFKSYRSIDQIAELSKGVADVQRELLEQVCEDFELAFAKGEVQSRKATLAEACLVIDALGDHARQRLVNWYCNTQLREYRQVFRGSEEAGSLDNIGRRYSWFNRMLKTFDQEHQGLFPREWKVNQMLANAFCEGTREDYRGILQKSMRRTDGQPPDVDLLLSCLQETLEFENSLEKRFAVDESRSSLESTGSVRQAKPNGFSQAISEAFGPYLSVWIESQDQYLASLMPKYRQAPIRTPEEDYHQQMVIASSTELFSSYRVTLAQCAKLSTGAQLLELSRTFARYLDIYCRQVLYFSLCERFGAAGPSIEDIIILLNTADYCYQTSTQLEERIQQRIDVEFREKVDLQSQADAFVGIASTAVRSLVRKVELDCEPAWREMRNTAWSKLQSVGDQSPFMALLTQRLKDRSTEILGHISKAQYARAFADNLVDTLVTAYTSNIVGCRPISETAAEQMLLDSYALKSGLLALATIPSGASSNTADRGPNPAIIKRVNTAMARLDPLLKTLQVTPQPAEALVQAYLIHIHDRSEPNFRRILEIKGIRARNDVSSLVDIFNAHKTSPAHNQPGIALADSNALVASLALNAAQHGAAGSIDGGQLRPGGLGLGMNLGATASMPSLLPGVSGGGGGVAPGPQADGQTIGERLFTAAREGVGAVERFNSPALSSGTGFGGAARGGTPEFDAAAVEGSSLNQNLRNIGRFFKREGTGFGRRAATPSGPAPPGEEGRSSIDRR